LPFSWKIDMYSVANPNSANTMRAFNSAVKEVSNLVITSCTNLEAADRKGKVEKKKRQISNGDNGNAEGGILPLSKTEVCLEQEKGDAELLTLRRLADTVSMSFRSSSTRENEVVSHSPAAIADFLNESRLPMPDGKVLDKLLVFLVELIESNMSSYLFSGHPLLLRNEASCSTPLWELNGREITSSTATTVEKFQSRFPAASHPDASYYIHGPASTDLEFFVARGAMQRRGPGVPLMFTRLGIAALIVSSKETVRLLSEYSSATDIPYPLSLPWRDNEALRGNVCIALLNIGSPMGSNEQYTAANVSLLRALGSNDDNGCKEDIFFTKEYFLKVAGIDGVGLDFTSYVNDILLPHCLRLCLHGNGVASTLFEKNPSVPKKVIKRSGVCPDVEFDERSILSSYGDEFIRELTHLPDPYLPLESHSDEAIVRALAILRR